MKGTAYFCYFQRVTVYTRRIRPKIASTHGNEVEHSQVKNLFVTHILTSHMFHYVTTINA